MKRQTIEKIFVLAVFILAYTILIRDVSLTGFAINLNSYQEPERLQSSDVEYNTFFVQLEKDSSIAVNNLEKGNIIVVNQNENKYGITVMQIEQDYAKSSETISLIINPGEKRVLLKEGQEKAIDFNNDGNIDADLIVKNIANGKATLVLETD